LIGAFVAAIVIRLLISVAGYAGIVLVVLGARAFGEVPVVTATASVVVVVVTAAVSGALVTAILRRAPMVMIALIAFMCFFIGITLPEVTEQASLSLGMYWLTASVITGPSLVLGALAVLGVRRRRWLAS
jgi:hypothetical protein